MLFQDFQDMENVWSTKMIKIAGTRIMWAMLSMQCQRWNSYKYKLVFATWSTHLLQVGEFAVIASTSSRDVSLSLAVLNLWVKRNNYKVYSPLDVVAISLEASAVPSKSHCSRQVKEKELIEQLKASSFLFCFNVLSQIKIINNSNVLAELCLLLSPNLAFLWI